MHHSSEMALEVAVKAAVGAPNVLGDCMFLPSTFSAIEIMFLDFDYFWA